MRPAAHDAQAAPTALGADRLEELLVRAARQGSNAVCLSDITGPDQPVVWVNDAFTAITGFSFAETVGRNCRFLQDGLEEQGHDVAGPAGEIRQLIDTRRAGTVVIPNRRADGEVFFNELALTPLVGESGEVRYYLGVQQDVTDRVAAERARDRSYREAAALADQLQNRLVPSTLVAPPEWDVAVRYQPATRPDGSRGEVSGDFYDLRVRPGSGLLAVLGDVSGRGPRAAATTAALRWSIRGLASVVEEPALLLRRVAGSVHEALDDRFATVAAVRLPTADDLAADDLAADDLAADDLAPDRSADTAVDTVVALAGHPQPVRVRATGDVHFVGTPGMLLGPFADVEVSDEVVPLQRGDCLVLYTDGVTEAASAEHELLGDEGLLAALRGQGSRAGTAAAVADAVLEAVARHVGDGPTDDLTLMVLRRR